MGVMREAVLAMALLAVAAAASHCSAHGTPIVVNVADGQLVVSNGVVDDVGYADWVYADPDPESWLAPGPGPSRFSTLPGFDVNDMLPGEELSLEVLSRPDFSRPERPDRWLWHWDFAAEAVTLAASDPSLSLVSIEGFLPSVSLVQETPPATTTLKVIMLELADIGEHRHTVLYRLDDSGPAEFGVYGFFARLKSPAYEPSEPFLVALNNGSEDADAFQRGALAINAAAGLAGDFDVDGDVDGADFLDWERTLGTTAAPGNFPLADGSLDGTVNAADLAIWQDAFGRVVMYPPEDAALDAAPEPETVTLVIAGIVPVLRLKRRMRPTPGPKAPARRSPRIPC